MALSPFDLSFQNKPQVKRVSSIQDNIIPTLIKNARLEGDRLVFDSSEYGTFSVGISALPPEENKSERRFITCHVILNTALEKLTSIDSKQKTNTRESIVLEICD